MNATRFYRLQTKVMFLHVSVILFTGGGMCGRGGVRSREACVAGGLHGGRRA